jgi:hypothetical protein
MTLLDAIAAIRAEFLVRRAWEAIGTAITRVRTPPEKKP